MTTREQEHRDSLGAHGRPSGWWTAVHRTELQRGQEQSGELSPVVPLSTDWRCCTGRVSTQLAPVLGLSGFDSGFKPQETRESSRLFSLLLVAQVNTASSRHASEMSILPSLLPSFLPCMAHACECEGVCVPAEARAGLQAPSVGLCLFALRQGLPLTRSSPFWLSCLVSELSGSAFLYPLRLQAHASTSVWLLGIPVHILLLTEHALFPTKASPRPLRRFSYRFACHFLLGSC